MTSITSFLAAPTSALDIPDTPDLDRMRRETGARLRSAMADRGVDALILLGNNSVVYATGVSWPLGDAGLSYVERPVAVVLADDPYPHLFLPFREGAASESGLPADHLHGPVYLGVRRRSGELRAGGRGPGPGRGGARRGRTHRRDAARAVATFPVRASR